MNRSQIIKTALNRLLESKETAARDSDFEHVEFDFILEWVINNADDPSIAAMWMEYSRIFAAGGNE